jgi:predicted DNA-binding transcriptional regulator YafY
VPDPLERVTNLLALLLESRVPLTLRQISDELAEWYPTTSPVALRGAFERDKAMLRDIGVPIETEVMSGDQAGETGYTIDRDRYELRGLQLEEDERHALQMAVATIRSDVGQEGVWKLGGSVLQSSAVAANLPQLPGLPALRSASSDHVTVSFTYHGLDRRLDPYGLLLRDGFWYVVGHDHGHRAVRTYRVDRIEGAVTLHAGETFDRPAGFDPAAVFPRDAKQLGAEPGEEQPEANVLVDPSAAVAVERELGADAVATRRRDGSIELRVPCANHDAFRSWVLGLGLHAEVLGPPDVRDELVAWLRALAAR